MSPVWRRQTVAIDCLLLALAVAAVVVSSVGVTGTVRLLVVLAAASLLPGAALLTRLTSPDLLSALALAIGLSLALEAAGALAMVWSGWWHPFGFAIAVVVLACAALSLDLRRALESAGGDAQ